MQNTLKTDTSWFPKIKEYFRDISHKKRWLKAETSTHNEMDLSPEEVTSLQTNILKKFRTARKVAVLSSTWDIAADRLIERQALVRVDIPDRQKMVTLY